MWFAILLLAICSTELPVTMTSATTAQITVLQLLFPPPTTHHPPPNHSTTRHNTAHCSIPHHTLTCHSAATHLYGMVQHFSPTKNCSQNVDRTATPIPVPTLLFPPLPSVMPLLTIPLLTEVLLALITAVLLIFRAFHCNFAACRTCDACCNHAAHWAAMEAVTMSVIKLPVPFAPQRQKISLKH